MIGVVIGRFQIHEVHEGHIRLLRHVQDQHPQVLVLIGCRMTPANRRDPLSYPMRADMLRDVLPEAEVLPVFDKPDDLLWSRQVDSLIASLFPGQKAMLYGGRDSFIPHYHGKHEVRELTFPRGGVEPSSTEMREVIAARRRSTPDFRAGVIHALATLQPRIYMCVDIAVMHNGKVLLGRKPDERKWRYIGGHVDIEDVTLEQAARREQREEAPNIETDLQYRYVCSTRVEDWRDRDVPDAKHHTVLYETDYTFGNLTPADDIAELQWFPFEAATEHHLVPDHVALFRKHLNTKGILARLNVPLPSLE